MVILSKIKELAKDNGITLKSLASQVGITEQGLHKMIKENSTSAETLDKIANVLNVSPAIFFQESKNIEHSSNVESAEINADNISDVLMGKHIHNNNINNSAVLIKALTEIGEHRKLISESHRNLTELTKAVVGLINKGG